MARRSGASTCHKPVSTTNRGVAGFSSSGIGVLGNSLSGIGVRGRPNSTGGLAGQFDGNVQILGNLTKSSGSFKIDHPLDPANKYLSHSFVESPEMLNVYNGTVVLDARGIAIVSLPDWFEALNRDFRYQLTAIGAPSPDLHIAAEIERNQFRIEGGKGSVKVSWQVTGVRKMPTPKRTGSRWRRMSRRTSEGPISTRRRSNSRNTRVWHRHS